MKRNEFIQSIFAISIMTNLQNLSKLRDNLAEQEQVMPVLFVGHGSPMNAIEENEFSLGWQRVAKTIPKPAAILCVSAHWETKGTFVTAMPLPKTIHDFGGFPQALFEVQYPAQGSEWLARETQKTVQSAVIGLDEAWGLDHGAWSVLKHLYPAADVPVIQFSLDYTQNAAYHYHLGKELSALRKKGVLIIGSGNMVHNFRYMQVRKDFSEHFGHDWAIEANEEFKKLITNNDYQSLIHYQKYSTALSLSAPTPEHYLPLLYALAVRKENEKVEFFNDAVVAGSFSMTSVKIG